LLGDRNHQNLLHQATGKTDGRVSQDPCHFSSPHAL
jgi:hypothetical protein